MKRTSTILALALLAGCGGGGEDARKSGKKGPFPVSRPPTTSNPASGGGAGTPTSAETRGGTVGSDAVKPPPANPPPNDGAHLAGRTGVDPGDVPPELVLADVHGSSFMISGFRGRSPVLLVFGATW
jgi:hypothetical protein